MGYGVFYTPRVSGLQKELASMWAINSASMTALSTLSAQLNRTYDSSLPLSPDNNQFIAYYSGTPGQSAAASAFNYLDPALSATAVWYLDGDGTDACGNFGLTASGAAYNACAVSGQSFEAATASFSPAFLHRGVTQLSGAFPGQYAVYPSSFAAVAWFYFRGSALSTTAGAYTIMGVDHPSHQSSSACWLMGIKPYQGSAGSTIGQAYFGGSTNAIINPKAPTATIEYPIVADRWYHMAMNYHSGFYGASGKVELFLYDPTNNTLVSTDVCGIIPCGLASFDSQLRFVIGSEPAALPQYAARSYIDNAAIFGTTLAPSTLQQIYAEVPIPPTESTSSYAFSATNITSDINMFEQLLASVSGSKRIDTDSSQLFKYTDELNSEGKTTSATARLRIVEIRQLQDSYKNYSSINPNASLASQLNYETISASNSASPIYTKGISF